MSSVVDLWDAASAACVAVAVNESAGITTSNCCRGGSVQSADLPRSAGILIAWLLILCWIFLGVALGADVFMSSIEKITSAERTKEVVTKSGKVKVFHYRVWNETMANLTLMALGSSAPEILINILEVFVGNFHAGALGPSTIVGSAAFNLFVITAVRDRCPRSSAKASSSSSPDRLLLHGVANPGVRRLHTVGRVAKYQRARRLLGHFFRALLCPACTVQARDVPLTL